MLHRDETVIRFFRQLKHMMLKAIGKPYETNLVAAYETESVANEV
jgi:hypothetical protein